MLSVGEIVRGPHWPETVEIKKCESIDGVFFEIEALGRSTQTYYQNLLEPFQVEIVERLSVQAESETIQASEAQRILHFYAMDIDRKFSDARALGNKKLCHCHIRLRQFMIGCFSPREFGFFLLMTQGQERRLCLVC
ncbi:hypothetical protein [Aneurinibacillus soli]|uniref:Uncharacterized protein n=1 Tax=Aneurinibacillus soli TaxID=1500254 RepID=A0A0U5B179_9BACL|nr:hypothetical protein CB4_03970 [Aneurinibacillus soli]